MRPLALVLTLALLGGCGARPPASVTVEEPEAPTWDASVTFRLAEEDPATARQTLLSAAAGYGEVRVVVVAEREVDSTTRRTTGSSTTTQDEERTRDRFRAEAAPVALEAAPVTAEAGGHRLSVPRWQLFPPHWLEQARQLDTSTAFALACERYAEQAVPGRPRAADWLAWEGRTLTAWGSRFPPDDRRLAAATSHGHRLAQHLGTSSPEGLAVLGSLGEVHLVVKGQRLSRLPSSLVMTLTLAASRVPENMTVQSAPVTGPWSLVVTAYGPSYTWTGTVPVDANRLVFTGGALDLPPVPGALAARLPQVALDLRSLPAGLDRAAVQARLMALLAAQGVAVSPQAPITLVVEGQGAVQPPPAAVAAIDDRVGPEVRLGLVVTPYQDGAPVAAPLTVPERTWTGTARHRKNAVTLATDALPVLLPDGALAGLADLPLPPSRVSQP